jgi:hypothetical protein
VVAVLQWLAVLGAALFAGGALYISVVEHPARMRAGVPVALAEFRQMYQRAAPWQASSAALCLLAGVLAALLTAEWAWAIGGGVVGAVIPFTVLVMMPVNKRLLGTATLSEAEAAVLLASWGRLHWIRSILGTAGLVVMLLRAVAQ